MRLGLIVNPIAGVGGPLALKGSDGDRGWAALAAGAAPIAADRAAIALSDVGPAVAIVTCAGSMGETAATAAGRESEIAYRPTTETSARDTVAAARAIVARGVSLLVFAGGDGTARDLLVARDALGAGAFPPVLGIPAGVKMLSSVFATSPRRAGRLLADWSARGIPPADRAEVLDRDAAGGIVLYGELAVPRTSDVQAAKAARDGLPDAALRAAAHATARELRDVPLAFVGPGSTMMMVKEALCGMGTLLGVDAYARGQPVAIDADAATLVVLASAIPPRIVLGVVGGQGFLLGRGNQQLTKEIIDLAGIERIKILADADKLAALPTGALLVDSGDPTLDARLAGQVAVITGPRRRMMMQICAA